MYRTKISPLALTTFAAFLALALASPPSTGKLRSLCVAGDCLATRPSAKSLPECLAMDSTADRRVYDSFMLLENDPPSKLRQLQLDGFALSPSCDAEAVAAFCASMSEDESTCVTSSAGHCEFGGGRCSPFQAPVPVHYYFLLDRSGSMGAFLSSPYNLYFHM